MVSLPKKIAISVLLVIITCGTYSFSNTITQVNCDTFENQPLESGWYFHRGDITGAQQQNFDDSQWRILDIPHDWTIEDLPEIDNPTPEYYALDDQWRFQKGDNTSCKAADFNDSSWQLVTLPNNWEAHSNYTAENVYGWFRRRISIPAELQGKDFDLLLGCIDDVDETYINGIKIGGMGTFPPNYQTAWDQQRRYRVPASLIKGDGTDVIAIRVFDGNGNGGINQAGSPTIQIGPFNPTESPSKHFTGNTIGGIGWYRKHFTTDQSNKKISVVFDGVYMNAKVWLNGNLLGEHPHGYTGFHFDLTPYLNASGEENVLAVQVRNVGRNSRWYSGSGIYRKVYLTINNQVHIPNWGMFITTPEVSKQAAQVKVSTEIENNTGSSVSAIVSTNIMNYAGQVIARKQNTVSVQPNSTTTPASLIEVSNPKLWSINTPYLYTAETTISINGNISDIETTHFGIRKIEADAVNGFRLNGEKLLIKGGCIHHDNGPLGSAAIERAEYRRIELLKANGYNAIRSSHNPPSSAMLEACDRLGMMVIDEAFDQWTISKENNPQDYSSFFNQWHSHDVAAMVRSDRNHPSVVMWSIGNEIPEQFDAEATQSMLREEVLSHDNTRLITQAISVTHDWSNRSDPAFKYLDIAGYNYLLQHYESDHARNPERIILTTESYPKDAYANWEKVETLPYVIGDFVWTALDYLGEAGLAHSILSNEQNSFFMPWPYFNAWCGDLDLCGFKKTQSYYRDIVWRRSKIEMMVHAPIPNGLAEIISWWAWPNESQSWNWTGYEGKPLQVSVYSRCDGVRLELNGKIIGEKPVSGSTNLTAKFDVPYAPGQLKAFGLVNGDIVAETEITTTGTPAQIQLTPDRGIINATRNDLCYVAIEITDASGNRVPDARVPLTFSVTGAGTLVGQASAVPNEPASFKSNTRETYQGRCIAILRPTGQAGEITLTVSADGFETRSVTILTDSTSIPLVSSCVLSRGLPDWNGYNQMDFNTDCVVNFNDLMLFTNQWLDDRNIESEIRYSAGM